MGQPLPVSSLDQDVQWLGDEEVGAMLDELPLQPMLAGRDGVRLSWVGAKHKLPVVFDGSRIGLPLDATSSSHWLKPGLHGIDGSVTNEAFCMALARMMGLRPAQAQIHAVRDRRFLLVERYDRVRDGSGQLQALRLEDFCEALGVVSESECQNEGGPDPAQCFDLVRRATHPSMPQLLRLFDGMVFNALIGNHGAHARNFCLLYAGKETILAPFDDMLSTAVYPALTPKMAMKIGSKCQFSEVQARHWLQFAQGTGLSWEHSRQRILELAHALPPTALRLRAIPARGFAGNKVVERIIALIEQRCALTLRRLMEADSATPAETRPG